MEIKDLFITPLFLVLFGLIALIIRPSMTDNKTRRYFLPALYVKFFGAIMLGVVYQFYYGGGDTFNYFTHGSRWIWEAFFDDPRLGLKLLTTSGIEHMSDTFEYSSRIWYYRDPHSYIIVRIAAFFDLFTFHTYSATTLFFAFFAFLGLWKLYWTFYKLYPRYSKHLAYAVLFVPSVFFWGSGILKDTVTMGALGWLTYAIFQIFEHRRYILINAIQIVLFSLLIFSIKKYILLSFLAGVSVWLYSRYTVRIKNRLFRAIAAPVLMVIFLGGGFFLVSAVGDGDQRYAVGNIAKTAAITANDIRYGWGARNGDNSGYTLGELDGSWGSMLRLMPAAINVTLFRPYLWEVRNPLMLLSAFESLVASFLFLRLILRSKKTLKSLADPNLRFCLIFSLMFAFAVGVSTFNFGTLSRYKVPILPFFWIFLMVSDQSYNKSNE